MAKGEKKNPQPTLKITLGKFKCVKGLVCSDHFMLTAGFPLFYPICAVLAGVLEGELPQ